MKSNLREVGLWIHFANIPSCISILFNRGKGVAFVPEKSLQILRRKRHLVAAMASESGQANCGRVKRICLCVASSEVPITPF